MLHSKKQIDIRVKEERQAKTGFIELPESPLPDYDNYPELEAGCLVISDLHVPSHSKEWIERVVKYAISKGIRKLVINGDLLDGKAVSRHGPSPMHNTEQELALCEVFFEWAAQYFSKIDVTLGNHDARYSHKTDGQITATKLIDMLAKGRATVHKHHHAFIGDTWLVAHPKMYSRQAAKISLDLIYKYHRNVASAHSHKWGATMDVSGEFVAIETGGCFDPAKIHYTHMEMTSHGKQQKGALIIYEDETFEMLHPRLKFDN